MRLADLVLLRLEVAQPVRRKRGACLLVDAFRCVGPTLHRDPFHLPPTSWVGKIEVPHVSRASACAASFRVARVAGTYTPFARRSSAEARVPCASREPPLAGRTPIHRRA